jgi:hypothetical protein
MVSSGWWTKTRGIPRTTYDEWVVSLSARPERQRRVLAWATTDDGYAIASPSAVSYTVDLSWTHLGWHEIQRGGWDEESGRLTWTLAGGGEGGVHLIEAGKVPEVFRERVAASIVLEKFVPILNKRGVLISGRRDLADTDVEITWNTSLGRGLSWQMDGVQDAVDEAIAQVRSEYDMR